MRLLIAGCAITLAFCTSARCAVVVELEVGGNTNSLIVDAEAISPASFAGPVPATVFNPPGWATASVMGTGGTDGTGRTDIDFYSFSTSGGDALFDVDDAPIDFVLSLFNGAGTLIA